MATFIATTASNGARLKDAEAARRVVDRYCWDGDVEVAIQTDRSAYLVVYGYDWPGCWKVPEGTEPDAFEPDFDQDTYDGFEAFLLDIAPHLAEPLTIQAVGTEKCRFPLSACAWHVRPGATEIEITGFQHSDSESSAATAAS
jgi:hypothetical protein